MTPAANPIRIAATALLTGGPGADALEAAGVASPGAGGVTTSPDESPAFPYVEVQGTTETEGERSDTTRRSEVTLTVVARATSLRQAEALAQVVVERLARRFPVPAGPGAGPLQLALASLDLYGRAFREPPPGARPWAIPVRLRYTAFQSADPGE